MSTLANDMHQTVRAACLWLPESEEFVSHGSPNFRVRGKTFATYAVNHHGDRQEIEALTRQSYRHFALKRMLKELPPDPGDVLNSTRP